MYDNHPVVVTHCQRPLAARLFKGRLHLDYLLLADKMI